MRSPSLRIRSSPRGIMTYLNSGCKSSTALKKPFEIEGETENLISIHTFLALGVIILGAVLSSVKIKFAEFRRFPYDLLYDISFP